MSNVYPGPLEDMVRRIAELEKRVRDVEYAMLSAAGGALESSNYDIESLVVSERARTFTPNGLSLIERVGATRTDLGSGHGAQGEPATLDLGHETPAAHSPAAFRIGDRCGVYTGGQPCVKVGTVEARESDGRWLIALDRAGNIRAADELLVWLPESWVE